MKALDKLGFKYEVAEGNTLQTKGHYNQVTDVEILITGHGNKDYAKAIGFRKEEDGSYTATGDFYGLRTSDGKSVTMDMLRKEATAHSKEAEIIENLNRMDFQMMHGDCKETGDTITLKLHRWVE